jgi:hypothetical protein
MCLMRIAIILFIACKWVILSNCIQSLPDKNEVIKKATLTCEQQSAFERVTADCHERDKNCFNSSHDGVSELAVIKGSNNSFLNDLNYLADNFEFIMKIASAIVYWKSAYSLSKTGMNRLRSRCAVAAHIPGYWVYPVGIGYELLALSMVFVGLYAIYQGVQPFIHDFLE